MSSSPLSSYGSFFEDETRWATQWGSRLRAGLAGMGVLLLVLLGWLRSEAGVWVYIGLLFAVALWGFAHLERARKSILLALGHLAGLEALVRSGASRDAVLAHLGRERYVAEGPEVPEALLALAEGPVSGDGIRVAAASAFSLPAKELNFSSFLRAAMVLGGLFGTVLFFALELAGMKSLATDPTQVISGLSGALVSTLTGIVGSLALGLATSFMDRHVEDLVRETEAFLGGPFSKALAAVPARRAVQSEAELWESLRTEVAQLTARSTEAFGRMGSDIHAHARALEALGEQLRNAPAIVVPPELANLGTVVGEFARGAELMDRTATLLVNTVATLGVFAPAQMLQEIGEMKESVAAHQREVETALATQTRSIDTGLGQVSSTLADAGTGVAAASRTLETTATATQARVGEVAGEVLRKMGRTVDLASVQETASQTQRTVEGLREDLAETRRMLDGQQAQVSDTLAQFQNTAEALGGVTGTVSAAAETISAAAAAAEAQAPFVASVKDALDRQGRELGALARRLGDVFRWHERAQRAPLMQMLTMPWRRSSRTAHDPPAP